MEKYMGRKAKRGMGAGGGDDDDGPPEEDEASVESALDGRGGALRDAKIPGPLRGLEPRIETLVIAGEPLHGRAVTAQGFLENCRCVRFQWATSPDNKRWTRIPGATMPTFFVTFQDVNDFVQVEATPVSDDGFEGKPVRRRVPSSGAGFFSSPYARASPATLAAHLPHASVPLPSRQIRAATGPIKSSPEMIAEVKRNVLDAKRGAFLFEDGVFVGGAKATLRLRNFDVSITSPSGADVGAITLGGTLVVPSRANVHGLEARPDPFPSAPVCVRPPRSAPFRRLDVV